MPSSSRRVEPKPFTQDDWTKLFSFMIRWHIVFALFRKEITETLRDRRTLIMAIGLPVLLYPLIAMSLTKLQESREEAEEATRSNIALWGPLPQRLIDQLRTETNHYLILGVGGVSQDSLKGWTNGAMESFFPKSSTSNTNISVEELAKLPEHPLLTEARKVLEARTVDAVLAVWPRFSSDLDTGGVAKAFILYDSVRDSSSKAETRLEATLKSFRESEIKAREEKFNLPKGFARAVEIHSRTVAPLSRQTGRVLGSMLPFILIILSASGGLYTAIDLTAGEKERNTLQTLLCAPLSSLEIITGKFLASWVIVLLTTLANLVSMAATFSRLLGSAGVVHASLGTYLLAFVVLLPATFMVTALFLGVAVFARDFKDGQNLLTPMFMLLTLPLAATTLPGIELNAWTAFVPLVNIALLIKGVFIAEAKPDLVFLTLLSAVIYAGLTLVFAAKIFQQEQVLLGGRDSWKSLFHWKAQKTPTPTAAFSVTAFAGVFVFLFYASQLLQGAGTVAMILVTQLGFFLLPNILMAWRWGFSPRDTYQLRRPALLSLIGALLIGLSAWGVTAGLVTRVFPPPESFTKSLEKVLLFEGQNLPLWSVWLLLGVTPAVCEELFFRGLVMAGFRRSGMWPALIVSSLLFAIAHSSIYRLLPTFTLGMILGFCTWTSRSMWVGITIHALNNSLLMTLLHQPDLAKKFGFAEMTYVPWSLSLGALAMTSLGIWMIRSAKPAADSPALPPA